MRRFSLMIFALAVLFAVVIGRKDADERNVDQSASTNAKEQETAETAQVGANEPSSERPGQGIAPEHVETDDTILKTAAILEKPSTAAAQPSQSDNVTAAPRHVPASVKAGAVDPVLEGLAGSDLNSAAQSELKRLGCYEAKIDGKWGRKSQAAVEAFGERAGGAWADTPRRELVAALRNYPAAFCTTECTPKSAGAQCAAASAPSSNESAQAGRDTSYLPPWMQGATPANVGQPEAALPGDQKVLSDAPALTSKRKKSKSVRRRGGEGGRVGQRYERRREWLPKGWPGGR